MARPLNASELELIESAALVDMYSAAPRSLAVSGAGSEVIGSATIHTFPGAPPALFNRVIGLGLGLAVGPQELDCVIATANARAGEWAVSLAPQAQPQSLYDQLLSRGFEAGYRWMKFRREVAIPVPEIETDLVIRDARKAEGALVAGLLRKVYGYSHSVDAYVASLVNREGWRVVVAAEGDAIVGMGAAFVRNEVGWFGLGATLETHRRRGAQTALLAARVRAAKEMGAQILVTETGERLPGKPEASYRNILKIGFEEVYLRPNLLCPALAKRQRAEQIPARLESAAR